MQSSHKEGLGMKVESVKCSQNGTESVERCSVIKYLVSKDGGLTLSQGTALDTSTLMK